MINMIAMWSRCSHPIVTISYFWWNYEICRDKQLEEDVELWTSGLWICQEHERDLLNPVYLPTPTLSGLLLGHWWKYCISFLQLHSMMSGRMSITNGAQVMSVHHSLLLQGLPLLFLSMHLYGMCALLLCSSDIGSACSMCSAHLHQQTQWVCVIAFSGSRQCVPELSCSNILITKAATCQIRSFKNGYETCL